MCGLGTGFLVLFFLSPLKPEMPAGSSPASSPASAGGKSRNDKMKDKIMQHKSYQTGTGRSAGVAQPRCWPRELRKGLQAL